MILLFTNISILKLIFSKQMCNKKTDVPNNYRNYTLTYLRTSSPSYCVISKLQVGKIYDSKFVSD